MIPASPTAARVMRSRLMRGDMFSLSACETVNRAARFAVVALLARAVGPEAYGSWVIAAAIGVLLMTLGDLGLATIVSTRIAADRALLRPYVANLAALAPIMLGAAALILGACWAAGAISSLIVLLGFAGVMDSLTYLLLAPLRARGDVRPEAAIRALQGAALVAAGLPVVLAQGDVTGLAVAFFAVSASCLTLAGCALGLRAGWVRPRMRFGVTRELAGAAAPVLAATFVAMAYFRIDALLVAAIRGEAAAGVYAAAYNVAFGATFIPLMFGRVLLPRFSSAASTGDVRAAYARAVRTVSAAALVFSALLALGAPLIVRVYGAEYAGALPAYGWLIAAQGAFFLTHVNYMLLYARGRSGTVWWLTVVSLTVNVALNLAFIAPFGAAGAGAAALASETALLALQLRVIRGDLRAASTPPSRANAEAPLPLAA